MDKNTILFSDTQADALKKVFIIKGLIKIGCLSAREKILFFILACYTTNEVFLTSYRQKIYEYPAYLLLLFFRVKKPGIGLSLQNHGLK